MSLSWLPPDGDHEEDTLPTLEAEDGMHPARFVFHPSSYARHLYDVSGNLLVDKHGQLLTVWTPALRTEMEAKKLRCIHVPGRPGYRFFFRDERQAHLFRHARETGLTTSSNHSFHIYPDEHGVVLPFEGRSCRSK